MRVSSDRLRTGMRVRRAGSQSLAWRTVERACRVVATSRSGHSEEQMSVTFTDAVLKPERYEMRVQWEVDQ